MVAHLTSTNMPPNAVSPADADLILTEYGAALQDERTAPPGAGDALLTIAAHVHPGQLPPEHMSTAPELRALAGLCPWGHGHWRTACHRFHESPGSAR